MIVMWIMEFKENRELILKQGGMHCTTLFLVINCIIICLSFSSRRICVFRFDISYVWIDFIRK